jgi:hypothetical protein
MVLSFLLLTGGGCAKAITTCAGNRTDDNFIKEMLNEQEIAKDD